MISWPPPDWPLRKRRGCSLATLRADESSCSWDPETTVATASSRRGTWRNGAPTCAATRFGPADDAQWTQTVDSGIPCTSVADDPNFATLDDLLAGADLIIDALLGTGPQRPIDGDLEQILQRVAGARSRIPPAKLVAVDLPSGLHADTGAVDPHTVAPNETVTFHAPKVGLYTQPGAAFTGSIQPVEIGIPDGLDADLTVELLERRDAKRLLPNRPNDGNKGTFGKVLVIAGSARYPGAAILAASAPYRVGAGLVTLATPRPLIAALVGAMPEVTYLPIDDPLDRTAAVDAVDQICAELGNVDALIVGCGIGQTPGAREVVRQLLARPTLGTLKGVVIDADGLNALVDSPWSEKLAAALHRDTPSGRNGATRRDRCDRGAGGPLGPRAVTGGGLGRRRRAQGGEHDYR